MRWGYSQHKSELTLQPSVHGIYMAPLRNKVGAALHFIFYFHGWKWNRHAYRRYVTKRCWQWPRLLSFAGWISIWMLESKSDTLLRDQFCYEVSSVHASSCTDTGLQSGGHQPWCVAISSRFPRNFFSFYAWRALLKASYLIILCCYGKPATCHIIRLRPTL